MKITVTLTEKLVKRYYDDLLIRIPLISGILILLIGSTGAGSYAVKGNWMYAISLEILTVFALLVIYFMNRNQLKTSLKELSQSEKNYYLEFSDSKMNVTVHRKTEEFQYRYLKIKELKHLYRITYKENKEQKIYIIEKNLLSKECYIKLKNEFKSSKKIN